MTLSLYLQEDRDCTRCTKAQKAQWGCEKDAPYPIVIDNEPVFRCPRRPFLEDPTWFNTVWSTANWVERGFLPESGTWLDQPAMLSQALSIVDKATADAREYKHESEERRRRAQQQTQRALGKQPSVTHTPRSGPAGRRKR